MNYRQIETFRAVMQTRSMTLAAEQLHTSQPNVSRAMGLLQKETGLKLFERVGLRVMPTPEADALLQEVDRVYLGMQSIRDAAERIREFGVGGLRIAASPAVSIGLLPQAIQAFRKARPHVALSMHITDSATIARWTVAGHCDLGLAARVALPQETRGELMHRERAVCIVPAGHRLARKRKVVPADLAGEPFISMPTYDSARAAIDKLFQPEVRRLELETSHAANICVMVGRGLGVSIVNPLVQRALGIGDVVSLRFEPAIHFDCHAIRPKHRPEQAAVEDFLASLRLALGK